jgi:hypothetical protein
MTIMVVLPTEPDKPIYIAQRLAGLRQQYGDLSAIRFLCHPDILDYYRAAMPAHPVEAVVPGAFDGAREFLGCDGAFLPQGKEAAPNARFYMISDQGRIVPWGRETLDEKDYPYLESHPFNQYSPRDIATGQSCFYYFPYGYLNRAIGHGPLNEFGHRIDFDTRTLIDRPSDHIVIVVFGGSCAYSTACTHEQMFSQVMQRSLNERAKEAGSPLTFTVLNYAMPGSVVLNEMITFLLFAARLRPNVVISHSGANDFGYSWGTHPLLLGQYDIVYQQQFEIWSRMLHEPGYDGPRVAIEPRENKQSPAPPPVVIRAYARRIRHFSSMAHAFGGSFVWGLQPWFGSKAALSEQEKEWIFTKPRVPDGHALTTWASQFYSLLKANLPPLGDDVFVDFDGLFKSYGAESTLMSDILHLDPRGDAVVGEHYASVIWSERERLLRWRAGDPGVSMGDLTVRDASTTSGEKRTAMWGQIERLLRRRARVSS